MLDPDTMTPRQKTLAVLTLVVALVLEIVDLTIVNTALPTIRADLGADTTAAQWIAAGYSLSFAILLLAGGRLGDAFGYRNMFLLGVAGFTLSSMACGLARTGEELVWGRVLQGATGAIMAPQGMALIQVLFSPLERVAKLALFGVIGGIAAILGPVLGGLLIHADLFGLGWRVVFLINLPVGLLALAAGWRYLPGVRGTGGVGQDAVGILLFGAATAALLWPLIEMERGAISLWHVLASGAAPLFFFAGWRHVKRQSAAGRPALFETSIFRVRTFSLGIAMSLAFAAANAGFLLAFAFLLQVERAQSPFVTGLLHMPFGLGAMAGIGLVTRRYLPRFGRLLPLSGALVFSVSAVVTLLVLGLTDWPLPALAPVLVIAGLGMGMTTGCIGPITFAHLDRQNAGAASGMLKTSQQFASALGVALVGRAYFDLSGAGGLPPAIAAGLVVAAILLASAWLAAQLPDGIFDETDAPPAH